MSETLIIAVISSGALSALVSILGNFLMKKLDKDTSIKCGVRLGLYFQLKDNCLRYIAAGYVDPDDLKALLEGFTAYKALGGDGFMDKLIEDTKRLPLKQGKL